MSLIVLLLIAVVENSTFCLFMVPQPCTVATSSFPNRLSYEEIVHISIVSKYVVILYFRSRRWFMYNRLPQNQMLLLHENTSMAFLTRYQVGD
ncbi:hypothetical protein BDB00DRAFT_859331 [Zychaea mexicana]|uniref:uncharacterized protein n=1 Tax=Zychaea mexicana TaxID=64656 RepID=UPI0022FE925A|nr:uncharacterized protein BDB00DRAFT_859331 [Zychaea mexicana]KAI9477131.1 hypothetical protein BDB00DRAFT_859331 [Zychaea mexicana]